MSAARKAAWADPAVRAKMSAGIKAAVAVIWTPEMDAAITHYRALGCSFVWIAEQIGVAPQTLMARVDALGISRRRCLVKSRA